MTVMPADSIGDLVKQWRERRRRSQLEVAVCADLSTKHLSYIETGRSNPSRSMIERICEELEVPLRERNRFYLAAGFAPVHPERAFTDLGAAHDAVHAVLSGLDPNPATAVNVRWDLIAANDTMLMFLDGLPDELIRTPVNVLRATLHPDGLAPRIRNLAQWRAHVIRRVRRQLERTDAPGLAELLAEIQSFGPSGAPSEMPVQDLAVPLELSTPAGDLSLLYTATVFGSPRDVTLDEIAIETFFAADTSTSDIIRAMAVSQSP